MSNDISDMTQEDGTVINDKKKMANHLNDFFVNIGAKLASKFSPTDTSRINVNNAPLNCFQFSPFSINQNLKVINSLDSNKASGSDCISARLLKEGS